MTGRRGPVILFLIPSHDFVYAIHRDRIQRNIFGLHKPEPELRLDGRNNVR